MLNPGRIMQYLELHLDHILNFKHHVKTRVRSTQPMMLLLRRLGGTVEGLSVDQAVKAIKIIIILRLRHDGRDGK